MSSGRSWCCSGQASSAQRPCSHLGHTATLLLSCTYLHRVRSLHFPVLRAHGHSQYSTVFRVDLGDSTDVIVPCCWLSHVTLTTLEQ